MISSSRKKNSKKLNKKYIKSKKLKKSRKIIGGASAKSPHSNEGVIPSDANLERLATTEKNIGLFAMLNSRNKIIPEGSDTNLFLIRGHGNIKLEPTFSSVSERIKIPKDSNIYIITLITVGINCPVSAKSDSKIIEHIKKGPLFNKNNTGTELTDNGKVLQSSLAGNLRGLSLNGKRRQNQDMKYLIKNHRPGSQITNGNISFNHILQSGRADPNCPGKDCVIDRFISQENSTYIWDKTYGIEAHPTSRPEDNGPGQPQQTTGENILPLQFTYKDLIKYFSELNKITRRKIPTIIILQICRSVNNVKKTINSYIYKLLNINNFREDSIRTCSTDCPEDSPRRRGKIAYSNDLPREINDLNKNLKKKSVMERTPSNIHKKQLIELIINLNIIFNRSTTIAWRRPIVINNYVKILGCPLIQEQYIPYLLPIEKKVKIKGLKSPSTYNDQEGIIIKWNDQQTITALSKSRLAVKLIDSGKILSVKLTNLVIVDKTSIIPIQNLNLKVDNMEYDKDNKIKILGKIFGPRNKKLSDFDSELMDLIEFIQFEDPPPIGLRKLKTLAEEINTKLINILDDEENPSSTYNVMPKSTRIESA